MVGLVLIDRGVLRGHQEVFIGDNKIGEVTSGTFSPSLEKSIGLARINRKLKQGEEVDILVRKKRLKAVIEKYPFI